MWVSYSDSEVNRFHPIRNLPIMFMPLGYDGVKNTCYRITIHVLVSKIVQINQDTILQL